MSAIADFPGNLLADSPREGLEERVERARALADVLMCASLGDVNLQSGTAYHVSHMLLQELEAAKAAVDRLRMPQD